VSIKTVGVVGGGAWGTALAQTAALAGLDTLLWAHEPETVADINARHANPTFLAGIALPESLSATADLAEVAARDLVLMVPPAQHLGPIARAMAGRVREATPVVICAKGIEQASGRLLGDLLAEAVPQATLAVLSGPSFAIEVARGLPAALTVACANEAVGRAIAETLGSRQLRLYWSSDVVGVQLGGAVKNVLAIAAGIVDGRQLGANAHAALVTRGFAEMRRFAEALGARPETMTGLAGLGDLLLTCGSPQSRNMSLGRALGEGRSAAEVLGARKAVTEGVYTAEAVVRIAAERRIDVPISAAVHDIVTGRTTIDEAIAALMQRPLKAED